VTTYAVTVAGHPKGEVFRRHRRWKWWTAARGVETYGPNATLADVREHIARVCLVDGSAVELKPQETG
jgi:hypothetical protein